MTSPEFDAWCAFMRERCKWRDSDVGRALYGDDRNNGNQIKRWRTVSDPPHYIGLACSAIAHGLPAWSAPPNPA